MPREMKEEEAFLVLFHRRRNGRGECRGPGSNGNGKTGYHSLITRRLSAHLLDGKTRVFM